MKEKTIQQKIFAEIKKRDKITATEIANKIGIGKSAMAQRMEGNIGLLNFIEMLNIAGYDLNITKAPTTREPGVHFGLAGCDGCKWKMFAEDVIFKTESLKEEIAEEQKTITE